MIEVTEKIIRGEQVHITVSGKEGQDNERVAKKVEDLQSWLQQFKRGQNCDKRGHGVLNCNYTILPNGSVRLDVSISTIPDHHQRGLLAGMISEIEKANSPLMVELNEK